MCKRIDVLPGGIWLLGYENPHFRNCDSSELFERKLKEFNL